MQSTEKKQIKLANKNLKYPQEIQSFNFFRKLVKIYKNLCVFLLYLLSHIYIMGTKLNTKLEPNFDLKRRNVYFLPYCKGYDLQSSCKKNFNENTDL